MNKKNNLLNTTLLLDTGSDCNFVLSSSLKNNFLEVNNANTVKRVEIMNRNSEKQDEEAWSMDLSLLKIAWNK